MRALSTLRQLPHHHALENVLAQRHAEHAVVQRNHLVCLFARRDAIYGKLLHGELEGVEQRRLYTSPPHKMTTLLRCQQLEILYLQICRDFKILQQGILLVLLLLVDIANQ